MEATTADAVVGRRRLKTLSESDLLALEKPAQYLGGERNAVFKNDAEVDAHVALCFPDAYEVGMSHVGIQILYQILNDDPRAWAERVYTPLPDMEAMLRTKGAALCSLESGRQLSAFDVVGFSLQYELCGTNILTMLELGGLAIHSADRKESDPLVIAGGPYSYHPEALAPFFDIFFLGDAEEFMPELLAAVRQARAAGTPYRSTMISLLRGCEGVYIPSDYTPRYDEEGQFLGVDIKEGAPPQVTRRLLPSMEGAPFPVRPVVPNINTVHNRLSVEVMRGCVRGCRFCQAGYLYRPQRERSPQEVLNIIQSALPETGFEEVSLLSLSTADYCSVVPLLKALMDRYGDGDRLAISFPSTRVDALTPEVLEQVQRVRRTGFTVAPEGGTQRLRDVINKGVSDEQILETCGNVFRMGWSGIKLYFMLGLPTETDDDLRGIIDIAARVKALPVARGKDITVSVSTHVPKPHTPFQWAAQISPQETIRKQRLLADGLRRVGVNFRYHEHFSSFLEGVFCRAGREIAPVIVRAYELGCRLDAWKEHLDEERWMQAFADCNIDPSYYLRERPVEEALPWDHLSCGIPKSYFAKEYRRALRDKTTPDCLTTSCSSCNACDYDVKRNVLWPRYESEGQLTLGSVLARPLAVEPAARLRVRYGKSGSYRFLGHLELVQVLHRALRRAEIPVCYSQGFHPLPRLSFGPPLQLGVASAADFFDIYLAEPIASEALLGRFNETLPEGIMLLDAYEIPMRAPSLQESFTGLRYRVEWLSTPRGILGQIGAEAAAQDPGAAVARLKELTVTREAKVKKGKRRSRQERTFALSDYLSDVQFIGDTEALSGMEFTLRFDHTVACPNAVEVLHAVSELRVGDYRLEKVASFFKETKPAAAPIDAETAVAAQIQ